LQITALIENKCGIAARLGISMLSIDSTMGLHANVMSRFIIGRTRPVASCDAGRSNWRPAKQRLVQHHESIVCENRFAIVPLERGTRR
jgi:hypothetical protein